MQREYIGPYALPTWAQCPCNLGFYCNATDSLGAGLGAPCPTGYTTSSVGASSISDCSICADGYIMVGNTCVSVPTSQPTSQPSIQPTSQPSSQPSSTPSSQPSSQPTLRPSSNPTKHKQLSESQQVLIPYNPTNPTTVNIVNFINLGQMVKGSALYFNLALTSALIVGGNSNQYVLVSSLPSFPKNMTYSCKIPFQNQCSDPPYSCLLNIKMDKSFIHSSTGGCVTFYYQPVYVTSEAPQCSYNGQAVSFVATFTISGYTVPTPYPTQSPTVFELIPPISPKDAVRLQGAPYYIITFFIVCSLMYGVILVRIRDQFKEIIELPLLRVCIGLSIFSSSMSTEIAYITALFIGNHTINHASTYGVIILLARLMHLPVGVYTLRGILGSESTTRYLPFLQQQHLLEKRNMYIGLFFLIGLDSTNTKYLPWLSSPFSKMSEGYPDYSLYRLCEYIKVMQSFISMLVQIIFIAQLNRVDNGGLKSLSSQSRVFIILSIIASIASFGFTSLGVMLQSTLLLKASNEIERSKHTTTTSTAPTRETENPLSFSNYDDSMYTDRVTRIGNDNDSKQKSFKSVLGKYIPASIKSKFKNISRSPNIIIDDHVHMSTLDKNNIVDNPMYTQKPQELSRPSENVLRQSNPSQLTEVDLWLIENEYEDYTTYFKNKGSRTLQEFIEFFTIMDISDLSLEYPELSKTMIFSIKKLLLKLSSNTIEEYQHRHSELKLQQV